MCEKNKKPLETAELTDEQLEQAAGGAVLLVYENIQGLKNTYKLITVKKCGSAPPHLYDCAMTRCPVCKSPNYTLVPIDISDDYYK